MSFADITNNRIDPDDEFAKLVYVGKVEFPVLAAVTYATPYIPAQVSGPPENCYPAEGGDLEWEYFMLNGDPLPGWVEKMITKDDETETRYCLERLLSEMEAA